MKRQVAVVLALVLVFGGAAPAESASNILKETHFTGGLIVQIGCGDGRLTSELYTGEGCLVQGLDTSAELVAKARAYISGKGLYGKVTARTFDGTHLPYRANMVNVVVVTDADSGVAKDEIMRVLAPGGVAYIAGRKMIKAYPAEMDDWPLYQHDPAGTMVGRDQLVAPPHGIHWMGLPKWLRNHDFMSSMHAMVATGGRVFYVIDEGLRRHIFLPSRWTLVARDAFNGTVLWKLALGDWYHHNWPLKSGPGQFPRRLAAGGGKVFVTSSQTSPLMAVDAVTGKTIRTYAGTKATEEIILSDGVLYLLVNPHRKPVDYRAVGTSYKEIGRANSLWAWTPAEPPRIVMAVDPETGGILWKHQAKVAPLTLTVGPGKVFFATGSKAVALDRKTGKQLWQSGGLKITKDPTGVATRAVYSDSVYLVANGTKVTAYATKDGKQIWTGSLLHSSHHCPNDMFVIDGLVWSANTGTAQRAGTHLKAIDLRTGEVKKDFKAKNLPVFPMHPRCYPSRATTRYLITNGMGADFYRIGAKTLDAFDYIRGSCVYGVMPCYGMLYKPPESCACYYQSKLDYFCALSPDSALRNVVPEDRRLQKGPAYGKITPAGTASGKADWPMYRHDPARSGHCPFPLPTELHEQWTTKI
ncbi:MAG: PQQ-binding-like beta-propeller repeat protein, partial [Planctomycetes bacterium]|nr:PQQ-binding-like beta-propeller repeat protein [Planctomycetota bacterium]